MKGNETSINTGSEADWQPENIVALVTGVSGFLASLLTFAYIKFKNQFSDEQNTDIHLQAISHEGGKREIVINIKLKNDERYTSEYTTLSNGKDNPAHELIPGVRKEGVDNLPSSAPTTGAMQDTAGSIQAIMGNNNLGDQIIGDTRNHVIRDALNTLIKLEQLQLLAQDGENHGPLNVRILQSPALKGNTGSPSPLNGYNLPFPSQKLDYKSSDSVFVNTSPINQEDEQKVEASSDATHPRSNHPNAGHVYNLPASSQEVGYNPACGVVVNISPPNQEDEHRDHASSYVTPPDSNQSIDLMGVTGTTVVV